MPENTKTITPARLKTMLRPLTKSKLISVDTSESSYGIALRSLEEVEHALRVFNREISGKYTPSSRATENEVVSAFEQDHGGLAAALFLVGSEMSASRQGDLVGRMIDQSRKAEKTGGNYNDYDGETQLYNQHFDYDGMGTAFLKSSVHISKVGGFYALRIYQAYVGDKGEKELTEVLGAEPAFRSAALGANYSLVEDDQFNVNLWQLLSLFLPPAELRRTNDMVKRLMEERSVETTYSFNGKQLESVIKLDVKREHYEHGKAYPLIKFARDASVYGIFVPEPTREGQTKGPRVSVVFRPARDTKFDSAKKMAEMLREVRDSYAKNLMARERV